MHRTLRTATRTACATTAAALALLLAGAASAEEAAPAAAPPAGSPLAKISAGMLESDVIERLGAPDHRTSYRTGKSRIPFYYGSDTRRRMFQYAGLGKVIFSKGRFTPYKVIRVEYDPNELGGRANRSTQSAADPVVVAPVVRPRPHVPGPRRFGPRRPF